MRLTRRRAYALITRKGKVLLVKNRRGNWTLPGGKAHTGEKLREAATREVKEETGMSIKVRERVSGEHIRHHRAPCSRCVVFAASVKKGDPKPQREIVEIAWVKPSKAPGKLRSYRAKEIRRMLAKVG